LSSDYLTFFRFIFLTHFQGDFVSPPRDPIKPRSSLFNAEGNTTAALDSSRPDTFVLFIIGHFDLN
jgi:hypothetical protein